jgi:hypothetical protein
MERYETPEMEVIKFGTEDVITTSGEGDGDYGNYGGDTDAPWDD